MCSFSSLFSSSSSSEKSVRKSPTSSGILYSSPSVHVSPTLDALRKTRLGEKGKSVDFLDSDLWVLFKPNKPSKTLTLNVHTVELAAVIVHDCMACSKESRFAFWIFSMWYWRAMFNWHCIVFENVSSLNCVIKKISVCLCILSV